MTQQGSVDQVADHQYLIDRIYEIALNPDALESFVENWVDTDLDGRIDPEQSDRHGAFDAYFKTHLDRAEQFLHSVDRVNAEPRDTLAPYQNFAALTINDALVIDECNAAAGASFGAQAGLALAELDLPPATVAGLESAGAALLGAAISEERTLAANGADLPQALLFRLQRIEDAGGQGRVLVVSTRFHWSQATADVLESAFDLTKAEQDVTQLLTEGQDAKEIAETRGTSIETVRGQIKAIARKLKLRGQADIVRFAMALTAVQDAPTDAAGDGTATAAVLSQGALESEFRKPFRQITLRDGRRLTFHDMGPPSGNPILFSHMGSCMIRWSRQMLRLAFLNNLRVICPIRPGYGDSDPLPKAADVLAQSADDTAELLDQLGIQRLPYAAQGTDLPFATALVARHPRRVSEIIAVGGKPCLPGGAQVEASGGWQRFFVSAARYNPGLLAFASNAVFAMSRRIDHETMLRRLCKDSPADLAVIDIPDIREALVANVAFMAKGSPNIGRAFAMEFLAFQADWSADVAAAQKVPFQSFVAREDPTIDLKQLPMLQRAYPWITFETVENAGLALMFQHYRQLVPFFAAAAMAAR